MASYGSMTAATGSFPRTMEARAGAQQARRMTTTLASFRPPHRADRAVTGLWLEQALAAEGTPNGEVGALPARADVCVVGGGYTGLWTALALKRRDPSLDVVLLEAGLCGSAASGRNGGFVMTAWSKFGSLRKLCGTEDALRYARAVERAVPAIGAFCDEHGIPAQFHQAGWLWAATNEAQLGAWEDTVATLAAAGAAPFAPLSRTEVEQLSGSAVHLGGVFEAGAATVHPAHLARGLGRVARRLGVRVLEHTPVRALHADPGLRVATDRGDLRSDRVVLAVNAWAAQVPGIHDAMVVVASDMIATDPIPDALARIGWATGFSISDSRRLVNYYRTTEDGRVVFGKGGGAVAIGGRIGADFDRSPPHADEARRQFHRTYPMLWPEPVTRHWRGAVDYSVSGLPFVGPLASHPQVLLAAGFSGNGVGPSHVAGEALAGMALGEDDGTIPEALRRPPEGSLPPEPLRSAGGRLVRAAVARKESAEDLGRTAGRVTRALAALDPTSFIDRGTSATPPGAAHGPASARDPGLAAGELASTGGSAGDG